MSKNPVYIPFYNLETGEFTPEFNAFYEAVGQHDCPDYDCNQVARAMLAGMTPAQTAQMINENAREDQPVFDEEDRLNHDTSMNG